jgi:hypothetical protein
MKVDVHIRKNATGEIRIHKDETEWDDYGNMSSMYEQGNYSCDCNLELFFERAADKDVPWSARECGHDRFTVLKIVDRKTGEVLIENI